jgi:hypothetical protein
MRAKMESVSLVIVVFLLCSFAFLCSNVLAVDWTPVISTEAAMVTLEQFAPTPPQPAPKPNPDGAMQLTKLTRHESASLQDKTGCDKCAGGICPVPPKATNLNPSDTTKNADNIRLEQGCDNGNCRNRFLRRFRK